MYRKNDEQSETECRLDNKIMITFCKGIRDLSDELETICCRLSYYLKFDSIDLKQAT